MLDANLKTQLKAYLTKVVRPIDIDVFVDDGEKSREMTAMLSEIAALTDKITVHEKRDAQERTPSFRLTYAGGGPGVCFAGIPTGHEFTSLVLAILHIGGHPPKADPGLLERIRSLTGPLHFETYISLSCHNCPEVVQALNMMAAVNPSISSVMIDGMLFQNEIQERRVMAVPTIFLNGQPFGQGRMMAEEILRKIDAGRSAEEAGTLTAKEPFDVLIIGGGPGGASAAIYAGRKGLRTGVVAERFGGQVMDTVSIENLIAVREIDGPRLVATLEQNVKSLEVDIMNFQRAEALSPGPLKEITLANDAKLKAKTVILATGSRWRELDVPGEREYRGKGVAYCPHCDGPLYKGKRIAVIGGGNSAVEAAIDLAGYGEWVTIMIRGDRLRADKVLQQKLMRLPNVTLETDVSFSEIVGDGTRVTGLLYSNLVSGMEKRLDLDGVFVQIGLIPNTAWLQGIVALNELGEIVVDNRGCTSIPGVFAAGDATSTPYKQVIVAMGDGAKASLSAFEYLMRQ